MTWNVAIYGDVNLNLIDGSAIWLQSAAAAFSRAGADVVTLLKCPVQTDRLTSAIESTSRVEVVRPFEQNLLPGLRRSLSPYQAGKILESEAPPAGWDAVVVRGWRVVYDWVKAGRFHGRLWPYLTDIPQNSRTMTAEWQDNLSAVVDSSRFVLCQTEELRAFLEAHVPAVVGRAVLMPPSISDTVESPRAAPRSREALRLVYAGKFAPGWNTLEMTDLPRQAREAGLNVELYAIGDKIHQIAEDPSYQGRMRDSLRGSPGVKWAGGMSRQETLCEIANHHLGLSWRSASLDQSLELSTKVLEYGSRGLPVLLNRTRMHETLLGADYPGFVSSADDIVAILGRLRDTVLFDSMASTCLEAAKEFTLEETANRLSRYLRRAAPRVETVRSPRRVLVASHDLKFFDRILQHLEARPDIAVRVDQWRALSEHDADTSRQMLADSDVVICEWCGPNAAWYSRYVRDDQKLIVRLHRFEIGAGYWKSVAADAVDTVVCVSPHYGALTAENTAFLEDQIRIIPNFVDPLTLQRPKYPGAEYRLGLIGIAPSRKRMDIALDVLADLRRQDRRFRLHVKSKYPWQYWWIWQRDEERAHYEEVFGRIARDSNLRGAVSFDGFGPDVGAWLRSIGFVLSTSDDESFHLSPAEGMMSGAVPLVRRWPGSENIYAERWLHDGPASMASRIREIVRSGRWEEEGRKAFADVSVYDEERVTALWDALIDGRTISPVGVHMMD